MILLFNFVDEHDYMCGFTLCTVPPRLWELPYYNNGRDHLLFNFGDHEIAANIGYAILAVSSYGPHFDKSMFQGSNRNKVVPGLTSFREGFDIAIPLSFYRCRHPMFSHLHKFENLTEAEALSSQRKLLLSFRGMRYAVGESHPSYVRNLLPALNQHEDVVMIATCEQVRQKRYVLGFEYTSLPIQESINCATGRKERLLTMRNSNCTKAMDLASRVCVHRISNDGFVVLLS